MGSEKLAPMVFKVCSVNKPCAMCKRNNIPVVMSMITNAALCGHCLEELQRISLSMPDARGVIQVAAQTETY